MTGLRRVVAACRTAGTGFMATGGLGGVHRGFAEHHDVSADLGELLRAEVLVVCSGVKSLLDVPATAELLETLGIPVLGYRTDTLPLFYQASGGPPVSARVESAQEAARVAAVHWALGQRSALLLARPPDESLDAGDFRKLTATLAHLFENLGKLAPEGVKAAPKAEKVEPAAVSPPEAAPSKPEPEPVAQGAGVSQGVES